MKQISPSHFVPAIVAVAISSAMVIAGRYPDYQEAYIFPNLLGVMMAVITFFLVVFQLFEKKVDSLGSIPWLTLIPGLVIMFSYVLIAEWLGFYLSAFIAFTLMGLTYNPQISAGMVYRCLPIAFVFTAVLYAVFKLLLQVQTPMGLAW